jgi:hypothetical protein
MLWDSQGPVLETYLEYGTTVTSATYCEMLQSGQKPAIASKRRGKLSEGILLLHDSACPHIAACTLETLRKLKGKSWNIQLTVEIWHHLIFTFLDCLKKL